MLKATSPLRWLLVLALAACQVAGSRSPLGLTGPATHPDASLGDASTSHLTGLSRIDGRVDFGARYRTQATSADLLASATVTLMDTNSNSAMVSTTTDASGSFSLDLGGWVPAIGVPYVLEASKGLANNAPGAYQPSFRTIVLWTGSTWAALSTPSIAIDSLTTAVALESELDLANVPPASALDKVNVSGTTPGLNATPVLSGHSDAEILTLSNDLLAYLGGNVDPIENVPQIVPTLASLSPQTASNSALVELSGSGFSPLPNGDNVTVNGMAAAVLLATPTELWIQVPALATSGGVVVTTARGTSGSLPFSVLTMPPVAVTYISKTSGIPGSSLAIVGYGFSPTPGQNTISFNGASTTPSTSSTGFCMVTVPGGAASGPILVTTPLGTASTPNFIVTGPASVSDVFPTTGTPNSDVEIDGAGFGASGSITMGGATTSVLSWSDSLIHFRLPLLPTGTDSIYVTDTAGADLGYWPSFNVIEGVFNTWSTLLPATSGLVNAHAHGWLGRWGHYLYLGGGTDGSLGDSNTVERAPINHDGSLGTFSVLPGVTMVNSGNQNSYSVSDIFQQATFIGNFAYAYGGNSSVPSDIVQQATMSADGTMTSFATVGHLAQAVMNATVIRLTNYVYVLGGQDSGANLDFIQRAPINPDSSLGQFVIAGNLPWQISWTDAVQLGSHLIIAGGNGITNGGDWQNEYLSNIAPDGSSFSTPTLGNYIAGWWNYDNASAVLIGFNWVQILNNGPGWSTTSWESTSLNGARLRADGSVATTYSATVMPTHHTFDNVIAIGGRFYVIGGADPSSGADINAIDTATLN